MKSFFATTCLSLLLISSISHAAILGAPFIPEIDARFNALEGGSAAPSQVYPIGSVDGHSVKQVAQFTYDFAKYTGAVGTYTSNVVIPANAIIIQSWLYSITAPTTSASGTLAFQCQNASDIIAATAAASYAAAGASIAGSSTGIAANFKYTTAACNMKAIIATGALTAGKVTAYVEYVVHQ
jgi:hypothetical protein